jgi:hypothetical protein
VFTVHADVRSSGRYSRCCCASVPFPSHGILLIPIADTPDVKEAVEDQAITNVVELVVVVGELRKALLPSSTPSNLFHTPELHSRTLTAHQLWPVYLISRKLFKPCYVSVFGCFFGSGMRFILIFAVWMDAGCPCPRERSRTYCRKKEEMPRMTL